MHVNPSFFDCVVNNKHDVGSFFDEMLYIKGLGFKKYITDSETYTIKPASSHKWVPTGVKVAAYLLIIPLIIFFIGKIISRCCKDYSNYDVLEKRSGSNPRNPPKVEPKKEEIPQQEITIPLYSYTELEYHQPEITIPLYTYVEKEYLVPKKKELSFEGLATLANEGDLSPGDITKLVKVFNGSYKLSEEDIAKFCNEAPPFLIGLFSTFLNPTNESYLKEGELYPIYVNFLKVLIKRPDSDRIVKLLAFIRGDKVANYRKPIDDLYKWIYIKDEIETLNSEDLTLLKACMTTEEWKALALPLSFNVKNRHHYHDDVKFTKTFSELTPEEKSKFRTAWLIDLVADKYVSMDLKQLVTAAVELDEGHLLVGNHLFQTIRNYENTEEERDIKKVAECKIALAALRKELSDRKKEELEKLEEFSRDSYYGRNLTSFGDCSNQVRRFMEKNPRFQIGPFGQARKGTLTAKEFEKRINGDLEKGENALNNRFYESPLYLIQWMSTLFNNRQLNEANISDYQRLLNFVAESDERILSLLLILRNGSMGVFARPLDDILKCCLFKKTFQKLTQTDQGILKRLMTQEELMVLNIPFDMEWNNEGFIIPTKMWADLTPEDKALLRAEWQLGLAVGKGFPNDKVNELIEIANKVENGHLLLGSKFINEDVRENDEESIRREANDRINFNKLKASLVDWKAAELVNFQEFIVKWADCKEKPFRNNYFGPQDKVKAFLKNTSKV